MGLTTNESLLAQKVQELETRLDGLLSSAAQGTRVGGKPPKPTGLAVKDAPGVIAWEWDDTTIGDFDAYRVQISEDSGMTNAIERETKNAQFTYYDGVAGTTYYARVATRNTSEKSSDFTSTVSSAPGTATADEVEGNLPVVTTHNVNTNAFSTLSSSAGADDFDTYGTLTVSTENENSVVIVSVDLEGFLESNFASSSNSNYIDLSVSRRVTGGPTSKSWSVRHDMAYSRGRTDSLISRHHLSFPVIVDTPGAAGTYEYVIQVYLHSGVAGGNTLDWLGSSILFTGVTFN